MKAEKDLYKLIKQMQPELNEGQYVFVSVPKNYEVHKADFILQFIEKEGLTMILEKKIADKHNLTYDFISAWITLRVHSSLSAIGLTAEFSTALSKKRISCNVISGFYHDHIFVQYNNRAKAMKALKDLSENYS